MNANELQAGDLILFRIQGMSFQHSAIAVDPGYVVHADTDFLKRERVEETTKYVPLKMETVPSAGYLLPYVYRCVSKPALATAAAGYARRFARNSIGAIGVTRLGVDRARGVQFQLRSDGSPPFEFDAIYRAFKWAAGGGKGGDQFSANKGTTCAAFVIACYPAAAISQIPGGDDAQIKVCLDLLNEWRVDKKPTRTARWQSKWVKSASQGGLIKVTDGYTRGVSNVGVRPEVGWASEKSAAAIAEEAWSLLVMTLTGGETEAADPTAYMTAPMKVDAKFCFTQTLQQRLEALKGEDWTKVGLLEY